MITVNGPHGPTGCVFGEATRPQRLLCYKLAATSFRYPLSTADHVEMEEEFLSQRPLTSGKGWRFWCLADAADPEARVLATCKTLHKDMLVRECASGRPAERRQIYCVATVIVDERYRGRGLATFLLREVARMDGPGGAAASMLYSSVGN
ncbi:hypothetical protein QBC46DRAFT_269457, partial [Diplogelasinospora grovesii]